MLHTPTHTSLKLDDSEFKLLKKKTYYALRLLAIVFALLAIASLFLYFAGYDQYRITNISPKLIGATPVSPKAFYHNIIDGMFITLIVTGVAHVVNKLAYYIGYGKEQYQAMQNATNY